MEDKWRESGDREETWGGGGGEGRGGPGETSSLMSCILRQEFGGGKAGKMGRGEGGREILCP